MLSVGWLGRSLVRENSGGFTGCLFPDAISDTCGVVTARLEPDAISDNSGVLAGRLLPRVFRDTCGVVSARLEPDAVSESYCFLPFQTIHKILLTSPLFPPILLILTPLFCGSLIVSAGRR